MYDDDLVGEIPQSAKTMAMLCHLCALTGLFGNWIGFIVGPLIVWLLKRNDHPFIDSHGKESLNFQLTMLILTVIAIPLCFVLIGFALIGLIGIAMIVLPIVAGVKANNGEYFRYPFTLRMIK